MNQFTRQSRRGLISSLSRAKIAGRSTIGSASSGMNTQYNHPIQQQSKSLVTIAGLGRTSSYDNNYNTNPNVFSTFQSRNVSDFKVSYDKAVADRATQGIVPKPLSAEEASKLVELMKNPPKGEEALLLDLLTNRIPPGKHL